MPLDSLTPTMTRFILHWGELGTRWGISRTVAQVHALLYLSPEPLPADQIATLLSVARSNVSTSLRDLQGWGVVRVVHVLGDRRDHFETLKDVAEMFQIILEERKRREVDPTVAALRNCSAELQGEPGRRDPYTKQRIDEMLAFFEEMGALYDEVKTKPDILRKMIRLKGKVQKIIGGGAA